MTTNANKILLSGNYVLEEDLAFAALTPGHLLEVYNDSGTMKVRKHSTAKGFCEKAFALESPNQGQSADSILGRSIETAYAAGERVEYAICSPGARVQAWLKGGTNYVIGDKLESAGDGTLQRISGSADLEIVATLLEAKDLSATTGTPGRADVRVH